MEKTRQQHWGRWIAERSRAVGYRNHRDLAVEIGCTTKHISNWFRMELPPRSMRKGFDRNLAAALKLDQQTLFRGYRESVPDDVLSINQAAAETTRRRVLAMVELMPGEGLKELARLGEQLLRGAMVA